MIFCFAIHELDLTGTVSEVRDKFYPTRAYGAIAPEPLGCASHSYLLTEESVTDKRTNTHRQLLILIVLGHVTKDAKPSCKMMIWSIEII